MFSKLPVVLLALAWLHIASPAAVPPPKHDHLPATHPQPPRSSTNHETIRQSRGDRAAIIPRGSAEIPSKEELGIRYRVQGENYFITGPSGFFVDANCDERTQTIEIPWVNNPSRNIGSRAVVANLWKYELRWDGLSGVRFTHINNERALASMDRAWQVARDYDELGDADTDGRLLVMYSEEAFDGLRTKESNPLGYMIYNMLSVYEDFDNYYVRSIEIGTRRNPYMRINIRKYT
ncbi:hypothetical protein CTRI78_v010912 [Colletotrichum trifolii]|uniref:Uncharacterized protein n=1 Tax=Colletotrichum trifolii TaxID=5466 RepID=A0A4R8QLV4_COLTR|nr:hypothetical protein CTRI78_v010912 [Colletotrichum trifolii]